LPYQLDPIPSFLALNRRLERYWGEIQMEPSRLHADRIEEVIHLQRGGQNQQYTTTSPQSAAKGITWAIETLPRARRVN
jgi:hypothetical protein